MKSIAQILNPNPNTDSPIEEMLFTEFAKYNIKPVAQHPVAPFFLDLAFPEIKLGLEADGQEFHSSADQRKNDRYRQNKLEKEGWKILRFTGKEIHKNFQSIVAKIVLTNFPDKLTDEQRKYGLGRIVDRLTREGSVELAMQIVESYEKGYVNIYK